MKVLSLGWGVQSWTLAAMVALGELEPVDAVIHSDTTYERSGTYIFAEKWTPWLEAHGVKVVTVCDARAAAQAEQGKMIPMFTTAQYQHGTKYGQALRVCTQRWKIAPMRRWIRQNHPGESVELWLGITTDEAERMKSSDAQYITNRWPLIEARMSRQDCVNWLERHGLEVPPKSACTICPLRNLPQWREMKETDPTDWSIAVQYDNGHRDSRTPIQLFLSDRRKPLSEIGDGIDAQPGLNLFGEECTGTCEV